MVVKGLQQSKSQSRATKTTNNLVCPKLFLYLLSISALLSILFHIHSLHHHVLPPPPSSIVAKLRRSVTFLPLKDLRYSNKALVGHTWFMSSLYDIQEEGEVQYQQFPSPVVDGDERMLCLKGRDTHDGSWNYYGLAWPEGLPENATVMKGVSFVSYNHYDYQNIWHGLSALMPFVAWHQIQGNPICFLDLFISLLISLLHFWAWCYSEIVSSFNLSNSFFNFILYVSNNSS